MTARTTLSMAALYEEDFVLWTEKTAELLRQKDFAALDLDNLIEEVEWMGKSEGQAVVSLLTRLIEHHLKLAYWQSERERNARHWIVEISTFRVQLEEKIDTTTLANHARSSFVKAYLSARKSLIGARIVDKNSIPLEPFFSLEQVLDGDWFPIDIEPFLENCE
jgi:Domain of unknown function DUF29